MATYRIKNLLPFRCSTADSLRHGHDLLSDVALAQPQDDSLRERTDRVLGNDLAILL